MTGCREMIDCRETTDGAGTLADRSRGTVEAREAIAAAWTTLIIGTRAEIAPASIAETTPIETGGRRAAEAPWSIVIAVEIVRRTCIGGETALLPRMKSFTLGLA